MAGRTPKNTKQEWIETAKRCLIDEGIVGVKVDRLANKLAVTRGGFYHYFKDRDDLLGQLLEYWETSCRFLPEDSAPSTAGEAAAWLDRLIGHLIEAKGYDHHFDLAVREWARSDKRAEWAVERADRERLAALQISFEALGYDEESANVRARVFYYHQIGYYAIGVRQRVSERRKAAHLYLDILCGAEALAAARAQTDPATKPRAA